MAINRNYKDKAEWDRGYAIGHTAIIQALDENPTKTKQGIYIAGRMLNKKMAKEHYTDNRKSDDFLAGMETAIQEAFQEAWENAPAEQATVSTVEGMPGLIRFNMGGSSSQERSFMNQIYAQTLPVNKINAKKPSAGKTAEKPKEKKGRFDDLF